jgi:hypothetical protein
MMIRAALPLTGVAGASSVLQRRRRAPERTADAPAPRGACRRLDRFTDRPWTAPPAPSLLRGAGVELGLQCADRRVIRGRHGPCPARRQTRAMRVFDEVSLERLRHAVPPFPARSELLLSMLEQVGVCRA